LNRPSFWVLLFISILNNPILQGFYSEFAIKVFIRFPSADLKKTLIVFSWLIAKKMFELLEKAAIGFMAAFSGFSFKWH
jgi:hypothetical protein